MLFFQNCGVSQDDTSDDLSSSQQIEADSLPFAFDLSVDHIAYMSCDSDFVNQSGKLFNFKAGAYNEGEGIKIRSNFLSSIGTRSKDYILGLLANSKRNEGAGVVMSVRESSQFQSPVRITGSQAGNSVDFGNIIAPLLWNPVSNVEYTSVNENLSSYLWDNPNGVNYLEGFSGLEEKSFDGEISYNTLGAQQLIRDSIESDAYLAFTFATEDLTELGVKARAPTSETGEVTTGNLTPNSSVWGKGYKMSFDQYNSVRSGSPRRAVGSVTGFNLENEESLDETWVCPDSEKYIIIKDKEDALRRYDAAPFNRMSGGMVVENNPWDVDYDPGSENQGGYMMNFIITDTRDVDDDGDKNELISVRRKVLCPTVPDDIPLGSSENEIGAWTRIRNVLPSEDWYVYRGDRYNCVVPKQTNSACYGDYEREAGNPGGPIIQYLPDEDLPEFWIARRDEDIDNGVTEPTRVIRETECEGSTTGLRFCPHILSVCYKR